MFIIIIIIIIILALPLDFFGVFVLSDVFPFVIQASLNVPTQSLSLSQIQGSYILGFQPIALDVL